MVNGHSRFLGFNSSHSCSLLRHFIVKFDPG